MKTSRPHPFRSCVSAGTLAVLACSSTGPAQAAPTNAAPAAVSPKASTSTTTTDATPPPAPSGANVETDKDTGKPIVTTPSGLKYVDLAPGTGAAVKMGDEVTVNYVGKLIDGTKFDASADHGGTFDYVQGRTHLIAGWTEGTSTMKVGGKRKLIIPPQLGYGMEGAGDAIPPNATLVFEIEVIAAKPAPPGAT